MAELKTETISTGIGGLALAAACAIFAPQIADEAQQEKMVAEATCKTIEPIIEKGQCQYKFNPDPPIYLRGEEVEVIVRLPGRDSTLFIGKYQASADTTSLIDVNVNLQPSAPPESVKE